GWTRAVLDRVTFSNNTSYQGPGAFRAFRNHRGWITNSTFANNTTSTTTMAGALVAYENSGDVPEFRLSNVIFEDNAISNGPKNCHRTSNAKLFTFGGNVVDTD